MAFDRSACIEELRSIINELAVFEAFQNVAFVEAHDLGIQGKKREARLADTKFGNIRKYLQSEARDLFGVKIFPAEAQNPFSYSGGVEGFLKAYKEALWHVYVTLHSSANRLVAPHLLRHLANPLYEQAECVKKEYVVICREIERYDAMKNGGTPLHDFMLYNTSDHNVHDEAEDKESGVGYKW